ncbi:P-loop containing nucleoside triphosphate hydrolase protein [Amanita muscaria]
MKEFGLDSLVINSDTSAEARKSGKDLWVDAQTRYTMILLSPEELITRPFAQLLEQKDFCSRVCMLGVDEIHLLHWWGKSFRPAFRQIGNLRARLPKIQGHRLPVVALTATLRVGTTMDEVTKILGLSPGHYHLIRRSNMRYDIQVIFRALKSSLTSHSFPDLDWVLHEGDNTVIFCKTILLGFRVAAYLWRHAKAHNMSGIERRIRLFNSLNWPSYNSETLGFLNNNQESSITIATDTLSVGWDSKYTRNAVLIGEPDDADEFVQKIGRIGRNRQAVSYPRAFLYYTHGGFAKAQSVIEQHCVGGGNWGILKGKTDSEMDISMARLLMARCSVILLP